MNHRDLALSKLAALHQKQMPLPIDVLVDGELIDTASFLESFRADTREAWPAIAKHFEHMDRRPFVSEVALSL